MSACNLNVHKHVFTNGSLAIHSRTSQSWRRVLHLQLSVQKLATLRRSGLLRPLSSWEVRRNVGEGQAGLSDERVWPLPWSRVLFVQGRLVSVLTGWRSSCDREMYTCSFVKQHQRQQSLLLVYSSSVVVNKAAFSNDATHAWPSVQNIIRFYLRLGS